MSDEGSNKRISPRRAFNILVQYRFDTFDDFLSEYAVDISDGGMFVATDNPSAVGSTLYMQFTLRDGTTIIEGLGRVKWAGTREGVKGMGIEFVNLDPDSQRRINEIAAGRAAKRG